MRFWTVTEKGQLLDYLFTVMADTKKTRVRQLLKFRQVSVNGRPTTRFDHPLTAGDRVSVETDKAKAHSAKPALFGIEIVYEDEDMIVIDKPSGLLTIATEKVKSKTAFYGVNDYLMRAEERKFSRKRLFLVHRLDQDTSGLLLFAKSALAKESLQDQWKQREVGKKYLAIVEGEPQKKSGTIQSFLREGKTLKVYSTREAPDSKLAVTHYRVIRTRGEYSLLEIDLETGRKHQIRVHLADLGHPIAGDKLYGAKTNPAGRLALHAVSLVLNHPMTGEPMHFENPLPGALAAVVPEN